MRPKIRVHDIQFFDEHPLIDAQNQPAYPGAEGAVWYIAQRDGELREYWYCQPFRRGSNGKLNNWKPEDGEHRGNVWGWDGNRETPTLTPSFSCPWPREKYPDYPYVHLFLTQSRIILCGDSDVDLV